MHFNNSLSSHQSDFYRLALALALVWGCSSGFIPLPSLLFLLCCMKAGSVNSNNSQQAVLTPNMHARDLVEISQDISKLLYANLKLQQ